MSKEDRNVCISVWTMRTWAHKKKIKEKKSNTERKRETVFCIVSQSISDEMLQLRFFKERMRDEGGCHSFNAAITIITTDRVAQFNCNSRYVLWLLWHGDGGGDW